MTSKRKHLQKDNLLSQKCNGCDVLIENMGGKEFKCIIRVHLDMGVLLLQMVGKAPEIPDIRYEKQSHMGSKAQHTCVATVPYG